jgi:hypothetical protein
MLMREIVIFFNNRELFLIAKGRAGFYSKAKYFYPQTGMCRRGPKANVNIVANDGKLSYA